MLECADGTIYVGSTRSELEVRLAQHQAGTFGGYTARRLPAKFIWSQQFENITDAIEAERKLKAWSAQKKRALAAGDWHLIKLLSQRRSGL